MNNKRLKKYLIEDRKECFYLEPYWIPKVIGSPRVKGGRIDLEEYRKKNLLPEEISEFEENFSKMFVGVPDENFIQEFPIPIFDRGQWLKICEENEISEECILNKSLISLDFFFPYRHLCIEIDGAQHWLDEVQMKDDLVRDKYLWEKYSLSVYRLPQFTIDSAWKLLKIGSECPIRDNPFIFNDWDEDIIRNWKRTYYRDIKSLDYLDTLPTKDGKVYVSKKRLNDAFHEVLKDNRINIIKALFHKLYEKILETH